MQSEAFFESLFMPIRQDAQRARIVHRSKLLAQSEGAPVANMADQGFPGHVPDAPEVLRKPLNAAWGFDRTPPPVASTPERRSLPGTSRSIGSTALKRQTAIGRNRLTFEAICWTTRCQAHADAPLKRARIDGDWLERPHGLGDDI